MPISPLFLLGGDQFSRWVNALLYRKKRSQLSLYGGYDPNHRIPLQVISEIWDLFRTVLDPQQNEIVSVVAFRIAEKL